MNTLKTSKTKMEDGRWKMALFATLYLLSSILCPGTQVLFPLDQMFGGAAYTKTFQITATRPLLTDNTHVFVGSFQNVTPGGGTNPVVMLTPNDYLVTFSDASTPWRISVPDSTNVLNALNLTSGTLPTFIYAPPQIPIAAGGGILITDSGGTNVISANLSGLLVTVLYTNTTAGSLLFTTNTGNISEWIGTNGFGGNAGGGSGNASTNNPNPQIWSGAQTLSNANNTIAGNGAALSGLGGSVGAGTNVLYALSTPADLVQRPFTTGYLTNTVPTTFQSGDLLMEHQEILWPGTASPFMVYYNQGSTNRTLFSRTTSMWSGAAAFDFSIVRSNNFLIFQSGVVNSSVGTPDFGQDNSVNPWNAVIQYDPTTPGNLVYSNGTATAAVIGTIHKQWIVP